MSDARAARSRWSLCGALAVLLCAALARAEAFTPQRQRELLQTALNSFDEAVAAARENPGLADQLYRQSAAAYEALIEAGIRNSAIEYNCGNAYFRLKDLGRAIVHYRRAQQIDPSDSRVAANLAYARQRVEPAFPASGGSELLARLAFWNRSISRGTRFWLAVGASISGWAGMLLWLRVRGRMTLVCSAIAIAIGLANAASVALELRDETRNPSAVVGRPNTVLRQGRGESYEAVLRQPLGPGVETSILSERGDWCEVQLANGQSGWLPLANLLRITP
jgi:tetratricopeptide (TPR) repeat protein